MKLSDRLAQNGRGSAKAEPEPEVPATKAKAGRKPAEPAAHVDLTATDPLAELKQRAQEALFSRLGSRLYDSTLNEEQLRTFVVQELGQVLEAEQAPLSPAERQRLVADITDDVLGHGPIEEFLKDPAVTEVMVNSLDPIYVERAGKLHKTAARFLSDDHLRRVIERIVTRVGRRIDESSPMVDARLPDGSRVNAIIPPLAVDGPVLTVRKFSADPFGADDLVEFGTMTREVADLLAACVEGKLNVLVSGGTGTGKTTLLNVLSGFIPTDERIVTIEDAVELQLHQEHVIRLESRPPNIEGKGEVAIRDLVRNALRMRPDRIVVGEVRGAEALDMLQAMNTGHEGSLSTVHANSPRDALARVETMVLMAGMELPVRAIREQIASAIDVVVHLARMRDGSRRIVQVTEVEGFEGQVITLQDVYAFDYSAGLDADGHYLGTTKPTGLRPKFTDKLQHYGVHLPAAMFDPGVGVLSTNGRTA
ncbi:MAG TPA: CpaF family protein [Acidimicrobiia bacterium]|nr:CpaF family protein [Acidimicrobiia bacterium]